MQPAMARVIFMGTPQFAVPTLRALDEHHEVVGVDKTKIKQEIRKWKGERDKALDEKDKEKLKHARREIHHLKVKLRKATR